MAKKTAALRPRLFVRPIKLVTFSFFLGFGLTSCFGGGDADEPVAAEEGASQAGSRSEGTETNVAEHENSGDGTESEGAVENGEAPATDLASEASETSTNSEHGALTAKVENSESAETEVEMASTPAGTVEPKSDTVNAELASQETSELAAEVNSTDRAASQGADRSASGASLAGATATSPETVLAADGANDAAPTVDPSLSAPAATEGLALTSDDGKSISSPGAARFIKSKRDSHHRSPAHLSDEQVIDTYFVKPGETLGGIATKIYGSPKMWHSLAELNNLHAPYVIFPGDELKFDASNPKAAAFAKSHQAGRKTVMVKRGDTLTKLASEVYGTPSAWKLLYAYNKSSISNPNRIVAGMRLTYVVHGDSGDSVADNDSDGAKPASKKTAHKARYKKKTHKTAKGKKSKPIVEPEALGE